MAFGGVISVSVRATALVLLLSFNCYLFVLSCDSNSSDASGYRCNGAAQCSTFAILRTNRHYSSLLNLSSYLGITPSALAKANGISHKTETEALPLDLPLLIPIHCKCSHGSFGAEVTVGGDIAESLEGLTSCRAIRDRVGVIIVPLRCACSPSQLLLSYPVAQGDTLPALASRFHTTPQAILAANNKPLNDTLTPLTPLLIPLPKKKKKKPEMWKLGVYVGSAIFVAVAGLILALILLNRNKEKSSVDVDVEMQQLSLSVRTTSDKKVSFEEDVVKMPPVETYTVEELERATDGFSCGNHIDGSVFHGRISGKNLAVKRIQPQDVNMELLVIHHHNHPNIMRLLGTCLGGSPSFLVLEYAKNGSLKDWVHGGLAMKNQFIASCYCFLTWGQRVKICLDVAVALHYMHSVMNPPYVHGNVKSRNIFLDEEFNAKIGMPVGENQALLRRSTPRYTLEPTTSTSTSPTIDIYAFGVVLLEVLSGKTRNEEIKTIMETEKLKEWMDSALGEDYSFEGAVAVANLGRACTEEDPSLRPTAGEVVEKLSRLVQELPQGDLTLSLPCESSTKPLVKPVANDSHLN